MLKKTVYARHIAKDNEFLTGVPSRDLSEDEWNKVPESKQKVALKLGLFEIVSRKPEKIVGKPAEEENNG